MSHRVSVAKTLPAWGDRDEPRRTAAETRPGTATAVAVWWRLALAAFLVVGVGSWRALAADAGAQAPAAPPQSQKGGVVMTFDDRNFDGWLQALPLFDKYGVHATFFISGAIDGQALDAIRQLHGRGHAIGVHGVHHQRAVEYSQQHSADDYVRTEVLPQIEALKAAGITPTGFAYPNSRNNADTDRALLKVVRHLRTGAFQAPGERVSEKDALFVAAGTIAQRGCLCGKGIDGAPDKEDRTYEQLDGALARAARNNEIIVLYAHGIGTSGKGHHVAPEALEHVFRTAKELQLTFYSFDELP